MSQIAPIDDATDVIIRIRPLELGHQNIFKLGILHDSHVSPTIDKIVIYSMTREINTEN